MTEVLVGLGMFCINMFSGALVLTIAFKIFDDTLRGQYLKEAFLASLRYNAIVNGALFLVFVIGMVVDSAGLTSFLGCIVSIGSVVLMAKMFELGLKEVIVMYIILWFVGFGIIVMAATAIWGVSIF